MGTVERFEGVTAGVLSEDLRKRLRLSADDLVDLTVTRSEPSAARPVPTRDEEAFDRSLRRLHELTDGSSLTSENCTDFLYDEDGLPA